MTCRDCGRAAQRVRHRPTARSAPRPDASSASGAVSVSSSLIVLSDVEQPETIDVKLQAVRARLDQIVVDYWRSVRRVRQQQVLANALRLCPLHQPTRP